MGKVGGGVHSNVNKKAKRFELVRRRLGVEKRKLAGLRDKHLENVALVAGPARTGKAARRALREGRRAAKAKLVRRSWPACVATTLAASLCLRVRGSGCCSARSSPGHANAETLTAAGLVAQVADGLVDTHMEQAPKAVAPAKAAPSANAMVVE